MDAVLRAFMDDGIVVDEAPPARWIRMATADPHGDTVLVRTRAGYFVHCMLDKKGKRVAWGEQPERWADGFDRSDVIEWVRLK